MLRKSELPALDVAILEALEQGGRMSTADLAGAVGKSTSTINKHCKDLAELALVESDYEKHSYRLLLCITCMIVITSDTYEQCKKKHHEFRFFHPKYRVWMLP